MTDDVYQRLREFLDKMPGGYPATDTGVEIKLLKKLITPEEAEIIMKLSPMPEPAETIAEKIGMSSEEASEKLEKMARDGSIYRLRMGDSVSYMAVQFVVGIYEFHLNTIDHELSELMEEYLPHLGKVWSQSKTHQLRIIPVASAIEAVTQIAPYDHVMELIKNKQVIAVAPCICRKEQEIMGNPCDRPLEACLIFDHAADYYVENGMARMIDQKELKDILKQAEEAALVLSPSGYKDIINICCCCDCCCGVLRSMKHFPRPADHSQSAFQVSIDPGLCSNCGTCLDRCQIQAIIEKDDVMEVDTARCLGCALCIATCPEEAISLVDKPRAEDVPEDVIEMGMRILKDRGML